MNKIPIVFCSDDKYSCLISTAIISLLEKTSSFIEIKVLDNNISLNNKKNILFDLRNYSNFNIEFVEYDCKKFKSLPMENSHVTKTAYLRFFIPELFSQYDKIIYSDIDVIFMNDINELFQESLDDNIIGAVPDAMYLLNKNLNNFYNRLEISEKHKYFYSGLLVIDTKQWNENDITQKLISVSKKYYSKILQGDQDILNKVFECKYKELSTKYVATNFYLENIDKFDEKTLQDLKSICIRHFEGKDKPWNSNKLFQNSEAFWQAASKSVFYCSFLKDLKKHNQKILKIKKLREILKIFPYFLVHKKIQKLNNIIGGKI